MTPIVNLPVLEAKLLNGSILYKISSDNMEDENMRVVRVCEQCGKVMGEFVVSRNPTYVSPYESEPGCRKCGGRLINIEKKNFAGKKSPWWKFWK
jgi:hypothetical protein